MNDQYSGAERVHRLRRTARGRRLRRWVIRGLGFVVLAFLGVGAVLAWFTVNPRVDSAPNVDALLVLATQTGAQEEGHRLGAEGVTDLLIVSIPEGAINWLCSDPPPDTEVVCFSPDPTTTQGEAIVGAEIARQHGAENLGIVTYDHHMERARLLVDRCWDGPTHTYEFQPTRDRQQYIYSFIYAMAAYGKTFLTQDCSSPPAEWLQTPIEKIKSAT